jgi:hypothetical protein
MLLMGEQVYLRKENINILLLCVLLVRFFPVYLSEYAVFKRYFSLAKVSVISGV